jgi:hypothetical protein
VIGKGRGAWEIEHTLQKAAETMRAGALQNIDAESNTSSGGFCLHFTSERGILSGEMIIPIALNIVFSPTSLLLKRKVPFSTRPRSRLR